MRFPALLTAAWAVTAVLAQRGVISPLASSCLPGNTDVVCINKYAAVMPYPFARPVLRGTENPGDSFQGTDVPSDPSFALTKNASFIVFDRKRGLKILGDKPSYRFAFKLPTFVHEAPVYLPRQNKLLFSEFGYNRIPQLIVDLNQSPPTLSDYNPDPPVYGINGGRFFDGLVYWAISGSKSFANGRLQQPGIVTLDPATDKVTTILNNYFGTYFNSPNDVILDRRGDVFFTDALYGYQQNLTASTPALPTAVYRFRPSTGVVQVLDTGLIEPNGIALSPDEGTLYVADSGAGYSTIYTPPGEPLPPLRYNGTNPRTLFAYDVRDSPAGKYVINRRPIYQTQEFLPDGVHVAKNGYILVAAGTGVDVLDKYGTVLVRVVTNFQVSNFQFVGPSYKQLWIIGVGGASVVEWDLKGTSEG